MRARWHEVAPRGLVRRFENDARPPLVLRPVHGRASYALTPEADGTFSEAALAQAREAFRYHQDGASTDIHPRLIEVAYRAVRNFRAPYVHLVSGYRTTRSTSRHNQGRAMDIVLPGVRDEQLASFLRKQGFVGVGVYPVSGFVHLDVRAGSYFWVDRSGPNQPSSVRPAHQALTRRYDAEARRRNEQSVSDLSGAEDE